VTKQPCPAPCPSHVCNTCLGREPAATARAGRAGDRGEGRGQAGRLHDGHGIASFGVAIGLMTKAPPVPYEQRWATLAGF
jgi:hypothetical protein